MEQTKTHPILIAAGVAVLLFSLLGVAALTGVLPVATPTSGDPAAVAPRDLPAQPVARPGTQPGAQPAARPRAQPRTPGPCASCGVIATIRPVEVQGKTSGLGALAGGVAGGLVGSQFGHGASNMLLTIGGAAGGAFAGDAVEGRMKKQTAWRVTVRLEDGSVRTLRQASQPPFAVGERVRIVDGKSLERA